MNRQILIISGPSHVGKNTMINELVDKFGYESIVTYTSRIPREEEINGVDYHFLSKTEFQSLIKEGFFVDWDYTLENYYGISNITFNFTGEKPKVIHVLARMALRLKQKFTNLKLLFLYPENVDEIENRLKTRFHNQEIVRQRIQHGKEEITHSSMFDYIVKTKGGLEAIELSKDYLSLREPL